jgi:hypothetical protein
LRRSRSVPQAKLEYLTRPEVFLVSSRIIGNPRVDRGGSLAQQSDGLLAIYDIINEPPKRRISTRVRSKGGEYVGMGVPNHPFEPDLDVFPLPLNDQYKASVGAFMTLKEQCSLLHHEHVV